MENLFVSLRVIFEKLYPSYSKKLWKFILDESVHFFIQMLLICSLKYVPDDRSKLLVKIRADRASLTERFSDLVQIKDLETSMGKLDNLAHAFDGPMEEVPASLVKLKVALGRQFNLNCIKAVLRLRGDFDSSEKQAILEILQKHDDLIKNAQRKESTKRMTKSLMIEYRITTYVERFRLRYWAKKKAEEDKVNLQLQKKTLVLDEDRKLEIEESLPTLRTSHELFTSSCTSSAQFSRVRSKISTHSYSKNFFSFIENSLVWKEKITAAKPAGKLLMSRILEIAVDGEVYVSMVSSL